ncbi:MAG TPA: N-acetyltransferase DgcN [Arenicellales bacterium]|nr:N-acetyltransferase DgcN [Arenicellales bacterium]
MSIETPYLLFLGDAPDQLAAKVAIGISQWRPENCVGQLRLPGCQADCGVADVSIDEAVKAGARTMVIGVANRGGVISDTWKQVLKQALEAGLHLASGLHNKLADIPELVEEASARGLQLHDVRHPRQSFEVGNGKPRQGRRLLPVGTDCSCGKMYTALAIEREMQKRGLAVNFRATGQTGILIDGGGVAVDAVVADFISGAVEWLAPENTPDHWDIIEGQGSLFHPSFAGVSTGLLHGAQPDFLVLCHEPTRTHMRGLPHYPIPDLRECMEQNLQVARLTSPEVRFAGIAVNTAVLSEDEAHEYLAGLEKTFDMPTVDPYRIGVAPIVDALA